MNEHFAVLRHALRRHGGDEFGTSGDSMFMAFSEPGEAIAATLEAQRSFADIHLGNGTALRVRMGLHTGPAVPDAVEGYVGLTVHEAARIMSAAHGGQVLLSARTASLVPSTTTWTLGTFLLKDVVEPMELHQLRHDGSPGRLPSGPGALPLCTGAFLKSSVPSLFVRGRAIELESIREAWRMSQTGRMGAALVGGEAGIGKTALVASAQPMSMAWAPRSSTGAAVRVSPFLISLADTLSRWTARASRRSGWDSESVGLLPLGTLPDLVTRFGVKPLPPVSEPGLHRFHQLQGLSALLSGVASTTPMLLVLDDMQWADASSVQLLERVHPPW